MGCSDVVVDHSYTPTLALALGCPADLSEAAGFLQERTGFGMLGQIGLQSPVFFIIQVLLEIGGEYWGLDEDHAVPAMRQWRSWMIGRSSKLYKVTLVSACDSS